jgi:transcriptional regulator with XRE-family HTH domain
MRDQGSRQHPNFRTLGREGAGGGAAPGSGGGAASDPEDLGRSVALLRMALGWRQEDLARAAGVSKSSISPVENASRGFTLENVQRLVEAMGLPPSALADALALIERVRSGRQGWSYGPATGLPAGLAGGFLPSPAAELVREAVRLVSGEARRGPATGGPTQWMPGEARERARGLWRRLECYDAAERRAVVREAVEFQSWALAELLCAESEKAAAQDAEAAVELGELAVEIAMVVPEEEHWRRRLEGLSRAFAANAVRAASRPGAAGEAFEQALAVWESGAPADPYPLDGSRLLDLEASLRRDQRRLDEALDLLDRALEVHPNGTGAGRLLIMRAKTLEEAGDYEGAVATLRRAAPQIDPASDPRLAFIQRFNLALNLGYAGRAAEGEELLGEAREIAVRLGHPPDLLRLRWVEGILAEKLGRRADAAAAYEGVRAGFAGLGMPYDAALATMELAALYTAEGGRAAEVKALVAQAGPIFEAEEVHAEARKALALFGRAAAEERVTVEMARAVAAYLRRARHEPGMRFDGGGAGERRGRGGGGAKKR